jgi:hypothetical protein
MAQTLRRYTHDLSSPDSNLWKDMDQCDIRSVLTYNDHPLDIGLNYSVLILTTLAVAVALHASYDVSERAPRCAQLSWLPFTAVLLLVQAAADCAAHDYGVSAVWAAQAGWLFAGLFYLKSLYISRFTQALTAVALAAALALIFYYAVVETYVTTVAHLVALLVGALCALGYRHGFQIGRGYEELW